MLRVTFLAHSGFLVEMDALSLLFDWWKGELPPLPDKPLLVFASHSHEDHFDPKIFALGRRPDVRFLLGSDLRTTPRNLERWGVDAELEWRCYRLGKRERFSPLPGVTVETLPSTDQGVAFLVTAQRRTVFHAGDLNWWHWDGEEKAWNRNMEANFKHYTQPLRGRGLDLAMLPLDPRLGESGFLGCAWFLELCRIRRLLPMHQWEDFGFTERFLERYPQYAPTLVPISHNGQQFDFTD